LPSTGKVRSNPNVAEVTLLVVKAASLGFKPVRPTSKWYVVTSTPLVVAGGVLPAALTVTAIGAVWVSEPEIPVTTTVAFPAAADDDAAKLTGCATPAARVNVAGVAVTPAGTPLIEI
jgi:hypothetical protein